MSCNDDTYSAVLSSYRVLIFYNITTYSCNVYHRVQQYHSSIVCGCSVSVLYYYSWCLSDRNVVESVECLFQSDRLLYAYRRRQLCSKDLARAAMLASVAAQAAKSFHERRRALSPPGLLFTRVRPRRSLVAACTRRRRRRRRHRRSSSTTTTTTTTSTALRQNETHSRIVAQRLHARVGDDLIVVPVASQKAPVPGPGKPLLQGRRVQLGDAAFALGRAGAELTHHHRLVELVALHAAHARAERAADVKDATAVRA